MVSPMEVGLGFAGAAGAALVWAFRRSVRQAEKREDRLLDAVFHGQKSANGDPDKPGLSDVAEGVAVLTQYVRNTNEEVGKLGDRVGVIEGAVAATLATQNIDAAALAAIHRFNATRPCAENDVCLLSQVDEETRAGVVEAFRERILEDEEARQREG